MFNYKLVLDKRITFLWGPVNHVHSFMLTSLAVMTIWLQLHYSVHYQAEIKVVLKEDSYVEVLTAEYHMYSLHLAAAEPLVT